MGQARHDVTRRQEFAMRDFTWIPTGLALGLAVIALAWFLL